MMMILVAAAAQIALTLSAAADPAAIQGATRAELRARLLVVLNEHRRTHGLPALEVDPIAQLAAQYQAGQNARRGIESHVDDYGRGAMTRYIVFGGDATFYGENLGFHTLRVIDIHSAWAALSRLDAAMMAERPPNDGHRRDILARRFSAVGIGIAVTPHALFLVEDFVAP